MKCVLLHPYRSFSCFSISWSDNSPFKCNLGFYRYIGDNTDYHFYRLVRFITTHISLVVRVCDDHSYILVCWQNLLLKHLRIFALTCFWVFKCVSLNGVFFSSFINFFKKCTYLYRQNEYCRFWSSSSWQILIHSSTCLTLIWVCYSLIPLRIYFVLSVLQLSTS